MEIKVFGSGCGKCRSTIGMIERFALASGVEIEIVKVENPDEIHRYGVHSTPAVVIGGKVVHAGGLPSHDEVLGWLKPNPIAFLNQPTRHLFFTGKGGWRRGWRANASRSNAWPVAWPSSFSRCRG